MLLLRLAKIARVCVIIGVIGLLPGFTLAQTTDRLVGSWNFNVTVTGGCTTNCKYVGMIAFNQGGTVVEQRGTVVEYNGLGYVERTALGTWRSTGASVYRFRMKNFVFDSTGKLSAFIVGISDVTLSATLNSFSGSGTAQIFKASGTLIGATAFTITGTRFSELYGGWKESCNAPTPIYCWKIDFALIGGVVSVINYNSQSDCPTSLQPDIPSESRRNQGRLRSVRSSGPGCGEDRDGKAS